MIGQFIGRDIKTGRVCIVDQHGVPVTIDLALSLKSPGVRLRKCSLDSFLGGMDSSCVPWYSAFGRLSRLINLRQKVFT